MKSPLKGISKIGRPTVYGHASTSAERKAAFDKRRSVIVRRKCAHPKIRAKLEMDPPKWLKHYFPAMFPLEWSEGHLEIIKAVFSADAIGQDVVVAAPRGEGKTTILRGAAFMLAVTGRCRFPIMGGYTARMAKISQKQWKNMLRSREFAEDYPEIAQPFEESINSTRLRSLTWDDGKPCGADIWSIDMVIILPTGCALQSGSLLGDIKGANVPLESGEIIRPDKLLLDDPQDVTRAGDPGYVIDVLETIDSQWMCLAGPGRRLSTMAAVTIKEPNDVGETIGKRQGTLFVRVSRVTAWPKDFFDKHSVARQQWNEWYDIYTDDRKAAVAYYKRNKKTMTEGMAVSWAQRLDKSRGDPDAFYSAMIDFYRLGEDAFFSEYQNRPKARADRAYTLTPTLVLARIDQARERLAVPNDAITIVAATDCNPSYGYTCEVAAFSKDQRCDVLDHFVYDVEANDALRVSREMNERERGTRIYSALIEVGKQLAALPCKPEHWAIDIGGDQFDIGLAFCKNSLQLCGIQATPTVGIGDYVRAKSSIGVYFEEADMRKDYRNVKWIAFNKGYWQEVSQRAWFSPIGAPGSSSLFNGDHREYARQVTAEYLIGTYKVGEKTRREFVKLPSSVRHDYGDVHYVCYMLAAANGVGSVMMAPQRTRKKYTQADLRRA